MATQFHVETNDFLKTQKGKLMQKLVVKVDGVTQDMYTRFTDDEVLQKGVYEIDTFDIDVRSNNGFTNLNIKNPTFKQVK